MAVTIYDIAQKTGFSAPTVSKALNNQADISEATREKITIVAREMGYVPNQGAKSLVTRKTWLIGVIFEELDQHSGLEHPVFGGIMNAFKARIEHDGYELIFLATNLGRRKMSYLEHCRYRSVDGVLVLNVDSGIREVLEVIASPIPSVSANLVYAHAPSITSENVESSKMAVEYLFGLGHRRIAHLAGPQIAYATAGAERLEGYRQGLLACGLSFDEQLVYLAPHWNEAHGPEGLRQLMSLDEPPTALYSASDVFTVGLYREARALGLKLPDDLSVISFDDNEIARYLHPALTTFQQDRSAIGTEAAALLLRKIAGQPTTNRVRIPVKLIERESCRTL